MQLIKKKNSILKIFKVTTLLSFSLVLVLSCNQGKKGNGEGSEEDSVTSQQNTQNPQQALQALQGDSAVDIEVSDQELEKFSSVVKQMQAMQSDINQDMIDAIEKEGMDVNEFNKIMRHQQTPENQRSDSVQISEESMTKFESASEELQSIQTGSQQKFMNVLQEEGLEFKRYRQIAMALQQDSELMQRFRSMSQPAGGPQGQMNPQAGQ